MGRTLETFRMLLESQKNSYLKVSKKTSFSKEGQIVFDLAQKYADASSFWSPGLISEKIIFSILFAQYIRIEKVSNK